MENTSYIKLFRKLLNSPIFENEKSIAKFGYGVC